MRARKHAPDADTAGSAHEGRLRLFAAAAVFSPTFTSDGSASATATLGEPRSRGFLVAMALADSSAGLKPNTGKPRERGWSGVERLLSTPRKRRAEYRLRGEAR